MHYDLNVTIMPVCRAFGDMTCGPRFL